VLRGRQPFLSNSDVVVVFSPKKVESPVDQDDGDDKVGYMSNLVFGSDITESQLVESALTGIGRGGTDGQLRHGMLIIQDLRDGDTDNAGEQDIWNQHVDSKDLEVTNKEIGIGSIGDDDLLVW
jgi:hypothetical protein